MWWNKGTTNAEEDIKEINIYGWKGCKNCRYWKKIKTRDVEGECKINPPIRVDTYTSAFPVTNENIECGKWDNM